MNVNHKMIQAAIGKGLLPVHDALGQSCDVLHASSVTLIEGVILGIEATAPAGTAGRKAAKRDAWAGAARGLGFAECVETPTFPELHALGEALGKCTRAVCARELLNGGADAWQQAREIAQNTLLGLDIAKPVDGEA